MARAGISAVVRIDTAGIAAVLTAAQARSITLTGARAAGKILKAGARALAPKRSGATKAAQAVKAAKGRKGKTVSYAVQGVKKKYQKTFTPKGRTKPQRVVPAFTDHLIQLGTRPHSLAKGARLARSGKRAASETGQGEGRRHPGARPNPYRKRAWEGAKHAAAGAAVEAMGAAAQKEIEKADAKVRAKFKGLG